ncbi:hypothetical protein BGZ65_002121 [Modicella reniformis]|uniref:Uncharacterized protein n=1 Tax=Modicella reniformis TaxID=1440133 RepID=A0A9P6SPN0_9FUNG|nr:hypothetical protein BGZ65_002121 [Modicella reniformis]
MASSRPQPPRPISSSPPSPKINIKLSRVNSDFYSAPIFSFKPLPEGPLGTGSDDNHVRNGTSNPPSPIVTTVKPPTVALTAATPVHQHPSRQSLTLSRNEVEADVFKDNRRASSDSGPQPFKVNPADISARPSSRGVNLTESELRGLVNLKRLSTEGLPASREGSPVPTSRSSEESTRTLINRIDELNSLTTSLKIDLNNTLQAKQDKEAENERLHKSLDTFERQNQELQATLAKRERDYEIMAKNYMDHVRLIRATDDDHSTIIDRLTQLKAAIEHLIRKVQGTRSVNLNRAAAIEHFKDSGLLYSFPVDEENLEAFHLNLYMESVVMNMLVASFFNKPLCCIFDYNKGFKEIYDWMYERNDKLAIRWRQQLCVMLTQDPETKTRQEVHVSSTANALTKLISEVYSGSNEVVRIRDFCSKAFDLAVAMSGQDSVISPVSIDLDTPFDEENMAPALKNNPDGKVALVIFPAFRDTRAAFNMRPKVWCH